MTKDGYFERRKETCPSNGPTLRRIHVNIIKTCNLACAHCLGACSPAAETRLETAIIFKLIDQARALGATGLAISGGEPLLHPGLKEILRHGARKMNVQVATNGTLLDESWVAFFAGLPLNLQISLDGPTPEIHDAVRGPGTFRRTIEAIRRLGRAGLAGRVTLATTLVDRNIDAVDEMVALARSLDVPFLRFLPLRRSGRAVTDWAGLEPRRVVERVEPFYERVLRGAFDGRPGLRLSSGLSGFVPQPSAEESGLSSWCPIGTGLLVEAGGDVFPCSLLSREAYLLGNIHSQSITEIIASPGWKGIVRTLSARRDTIETCAACLWKNLCQGGCMGLACDRHGTVWATDDFCAFRKKAYAWAFEKILSHPVPSGGSDAGN